MESLWEITGKTPETHNETWFLETYGQLIQDALAKLRNPPDPSHPALTWQLFKQVRIGELAKVKVFSRVLQFSFRKLDLSMNLTLAYHLWNASAVISFIMFPDEVCTFTELLLILLVFHYSYITVYSKGHRRGPAWYLIWRR